MVQIRVMASDADAVSDVLERMLPLLRSSPHLVVGDARDLGMRGPGRRVVFELVPVDAPVTVTTERVDVDPGPARRPRGRPVRGELEPRR